MLISEEYRKAQQYLHSQPGYGVTSAVYAGLVDSIIDRLEFDEILDYGCGAKCTLLHSLKTKRKVRYQAYDPAVPEYSGEAVPSELVACLDVLEHIEPDCLYDVLADLQRVTKEVGIFSITCGPAMKVLPDGRNAHLIQEPPEWWVERLMANFELQTFQRMESTSDKVKMFYVIVKPLTSRRIILGS
jgi:hypothetical protein